MSTINKVILLGNVGSVDVKTLDGGRKLVQASIATSEGYKDKNGDWQNKTEWHRLLFAIPSIIERAESISKGDSIYVEGSISTNSWTTKDGESKETKEISCTTLKVFKRNESQSNQSSGNKANAKAEKSAISVDDDLPF